MPNAPATTQTDATGRPRVSFIGFIIPVALVAAIGAAGLYLYDQHERHRKQLAEVIIAGNALLERHDLGSLKAAEARYRAALELDAGSSYAHTGLAAALFQQWEHGDTAKLAEAKTALAQAKAEGAASPGFFATEAMIATAEGHPEQAEAALRTELEAGVINPKMLYALGLSLAAQGKLQEAEQRMRQAAEGDFTAAAFRLGLAGLAERRGKPRAAIKELSELSRVSPKHALAKAWRAALLLKSLSGLSTPLALISEAKAKKERGPRTEGLILWAEGEAALSVGNAQLALDKAAAAQKLLGNYPPLFELKARAYRAMGRPQDAIAALEAGVKADPSYRGLMWSLAEHKSEQQDDSALTLLAKLEGSEPGPPGAKYEIFRGEHALRQGKLAKARQHFTAAAEQGDEADILLGLAKVSFEEERKKGRRADMKKIGDAMEAALAHQRLFPKAQEYLGDISLWNYMVPAANAAYEAAERQYKQLRRPTPELMRFYDHVIGALRGAKAAAVRGKARRLASGWEKKKQAYLQAASSIER